MFQGKKVIYLLLFGLLMVFILAGCGAKTENEKDMNSAAVTYTIADATGDWGFPAPYTHYLRGPGYVRMSFIFDTLVWKDQEGFTEALADKWEYLEEENAFLFNLRKDVTWHDGEKFTADDVVFTFQYTRENPYPWSDTTIVKNVEALDEYTVKVYLEKPYAPFLANVAGTLPIIPRHIYENIENPRDCKDMKAATGTGPFKLVDYNKEHGTYLYEANPDYYLGKPQVDKIRFIKVGKQMIPSALLEGTVNAGDIPAEMIAKFTGKEFIVLTSDHSWNAKLMFNHQEEPFSDKKFRQAIAYAINRGKLVEIAQRGHALQGSPGIFAPDNPWYSPEINNYSFSPEKGRKLLEELGYEWKDGVLYKDGRALQIELLIKSRFARDAELIKADLEDIGIKVELRSLEDKTVDSKIEDWDFQMAISGHGGLGGDPQNLNKFILGKGFNSARYFENEELTGLLKKQLSVMDSAERKKIVARIQKMYSEELPTLTLYYPDWQWAHDGKVDLYYTPGGMALGIPIPLNKLSFVKP
ncbi:MAG: peptide/nickel transport system substrate-binding protein [Clostridia bacterium]|nr:gsiB1 [Clostridiales bacterium]MDK2985044.1 peptide/nickel transport system substrate-binding protein [Clostridia bacterium]